MMKSIHIIVAVLFVITSSYSCVVVRGQQRFVKQIQTINEEIDKWYKEESVSAQSFSESFDATSEAYRQSKDYHWPSQMMRLLQVVTGVSPSSQIDKISVIRMTSGLKYKDLAVQREFIANFGKFLTTKFESKDQAAALKREVFVGLKETLCAPYRGESEAHFNFRSAINYLVRYARSENVDDERFNQHVVYTNQPIAQLYSAALICQFIDSIEANVVPENDRQLKLDFPIDSEGQEIAVDFPYPRFISGFRED